METDDWFDLVSEYDDGMEGLVNAIEEIPHDIFFNRALPPTNPPPWYLPPKRLESQNHTEPFLHQPEGFDFGGPHGEGW